jgi:ornithine cyclodeaminase/alanine dehydrogenase-like protein (mu-crystallin family)
MALMLGAEALEGVVEMREAIELLDAMSQHEAAGKTFVSPRLNSAFDGGWMRMMFAADYVAGYAATKAFHMIDEVGVRYVLSLYRLADGELLAVLDGRLITDLRTGAASGVIARKLKIEGPITVGLIGAGNQARMQLEALASVYRVESAAVYSPTPENRERLARQMSSKLGMPVMAEATAEAATRGHTIVVTATSSQSSQAVLRAEWLGECRLLCAVGSTRPQSIEVDEASFRAAKLVVVDTPRAAEEAGDLHYAVKSGAVGAEQQKTLAQVASGAASLPDSGLVVFKSVGTALQDLALAVRYFELLRGRKDLPGALDLASLKKPVSAKGRGRAADEVKK